jgi:hypothetical protein
LEVRQTGSFASPPFDGFALGKSERRFSNMNPARQIVSCVTDAALLI